MKHANASASSSSTANTNTGASNMRKVVASDIYGDTTDEETPVQNHNVGPKGPKVDKFRKQVEHGPKKFIKP